MNIWYQHVGSFGPEIPWAPGTSDLMIKTHAIRDRRFLCYSFWVGLIIALLLSMQERRSRRSRELAILTGAQPPAEATTGRKPRAAAANANFAMALCTKGSKALAEILHDGDFYTGFESPEKLVSSDPRPSKRARRSTKDGGQSDAPAPEDKQQSASVSDIKAAPAQAAAPAPVPAPAATPATAKAQVSSKQGGGVSRASPRTRHQAGAQSLAPKYKEMSSSESESDLEPDADVAEPMSEADTDTEEDAHDLAVCMVPPTVAAVLLPPVAYQDGKPWVFPRQAADTAPAPATAMKEEQTESCQEPSASTALEPQTAQPQTAQPTEDPDRTCSETTRSGQIDGQAALGRTVSIGTTSAQDDRVAESVDCTKAGPRSSGLMDVKPEQAAEGALLPSDNPGVPEGSAPASPTKATRRSGKPPISPALDGGKALTSQQQGLVDQLKAVLNGSGLEQGVRQLLKLAPLSGLKVEYRKVCSPIFSTWANVRLSSSSCGDMLVRITCSCPTHGSRTGDWCRIMIVVTHIAWTAHEPYGDMAF